MKYSKQNGIPTEGPRCKVNKIVNFVKRQLGN